jgi:hydrogenase maturation protein HypF
MTTSVGRLFDGIAALLNLVKTVSFEGQGAIALAAQVMESDNGQVYPYNLAVDAKKTIIDWRPMIRAIAEDLSTKTVATIAQQFHHTLIEIIVAIAHQQQLKTVVLSGGCFQNRYLLDQGIRQLTQAGFTPCWPTQIPPNDGGLCLGQLLAKVQPRRYQA